MMRTITLKTERVNLGDGQEGTVFVLDDIVNQLTPDECMSLAVSCGYVLIHAVPMTREDFIEDLNSGLDGCLTAAVEPEVLEGGDHVPSPN